MPPQHSYFQILKKNFVIKNQIFFYTLGMYDVSNK